MSNVARVTLDETAKFQLLVANAVGIDPSMVHKLTIVIEAGRLMTCDIECYANRALLEAGLEVVEMTTTRFKLIPIEESDQ
jgi:hypothetical protein